MSNPWKRLAGWLPGGQPPRDGDAALRALSDVTELRRQLDQVELAAVCAARQHRKSWTEIATMLAITRQSAWERWRDLDGDTDSAHTANPADAGPDRAAATSLASRARRKRTVTVPDLIGLTSAEALGILTGSGLEAESATPDLDLLDLSDDLRPIVVVRQYPDPGTRVLAATTVRLWLERGDGEAGVREPRRPGPPPRVGRMERDERTEEAVG